MIIPEADSCEEPNFPRAGMKDDPFPAFLSVYSQCQNFAVLVKMKEKPTQSLPSLVALCSCSMPPPVKLAPWHRFPKKEQKRFSPSLVFNLVGLGTALGNESNA